MKKEPQLTLWLFSFYDEWHSRECEYLLLHVTMTSSFRPEASQSEAGVENLRLSVNPLDTSIEIML